MGPGAVAAVAAVLLAGRARPRRHLGAMVRGAQVNQPARPQNTRSPVRIALAAVALVGVVAVIGGAAGLGAGLVLAAAIALLPPRDRTVGVPPDEVPIVIDLVAGCLDAGASLPAALDAAAMTSTGVLRDRCVGAAAGLRAGLVGMDVWQIWLDDPNLAGFARTAQRTSHSGAAAAADFRRTAARLRARRRAAAHERVRQASVWLVVPLGLCFLPAFVLVAVVPIVIGLLPALHL